MDFYVPGRTLLLSFFMILVLQKILVPRHFPQKSATKQHPEHKLSGFIGIRKRLHSFILLVKEENLKGVNSQEV